MVPPRRLLFKSERVTYSPDVWTVDASKGQNDTFPLVEQALVQLEPSTPDGVITMTVTCGYDDFAPEIENPPAGVTPADLRVLERAFQLWDSDTFRNEMVLARGELKSNRGKA